MVQSLRKIRRILQIQLVQRDLVVLSALLVQKTRRSLQVQSVPEVQSVLEWQDFRVDLEYLTVLVVQWVR